MKILRHKSSNKVRVLMRRERIQKIACNHYITADMKLNSMANSDGKAWIWYAVDFADDERKEELFAIRLELLAVGRLYALSASAGQCVILCIGLRPQR